MLIKRAEFVLFNNIKTKYFENNYYIKSNIRKKDTKKKYKSKVKRKRKLLFLI